MLAAAASKHRRGPLGQSGLRAIVSSLGVGLLLCLMAPRAWIPPSSDVAKRSSSRFLQRPYLDRIPKNKYPPEPKPEITMPLAERERLIYEIALQEAGAIGDWSSAFRLLDLLKGKGFKLHDSNWGWAIESCRKSGRWQDVVDLIEDMVAYGAKLEHDTFHAALVPLELASTKVDVHQDAEKVFNMMKQQGFPPNQVTYRKMMVIYANSEQPEKCDELYAEAQNYGMLQLLKNHGMCLDVSTFSAKAAGVIVKHFVKIKALDAHMCTKAGRGGFFIIHGDEGIKRDKSRAVKDAVKSFKIKARKDHTAHERLRVTWEDLQKVGERLALDKRNLKEQKENRLARERTLRSTMEARQAPPRKTKEDSFNHQGGSGEVLQSSDQNDEFVVQDLS